MSQKISRTLIDEAVRWVVKIDFSQPSPATRQAFERWIAASETHLAAWQYVAGVRTTFDQVPAKLALNVLESAEKARVASRTGRRHALKLVLLTGAIGAGGWVAREHAPWQRLVADAATGVGQRSTIRLADGTVVMLNTDSAISSRFAPSQRMLIARRGEISITTGADAEFVARDGHKRPFLAETPFGLLRALGTRFVVRLEEDRARISVQEGAVQMTPAQGGNAVVVHAGESWWLSATSAQPAEQSGLSVNGWEDGLMIADNMRLEDFLAELSRYRVGSLGCDTAIANLRVSGIYHISDTDQVLRFLTSTQPVAVVYRTRFWVRLIASTAA